MRGLFTKEDSGIDSRRPMDASRRSILFSSADFILRTFPEISGVSRLAGGSGANYCIPSILDEDKSLLLPELIIERSAEDKFGITQTEEIGIEDSGTRVFERVELERRIDEIRPDIVGYIDESPLLIEVAVTHFVGKEKKGLIRKLCLPAIEIDLHSANYATTKEELRSLLNSESTKKEWLVAPVLPISKFQRRMPMLPVVNGMESTLMAN